MIVKLLQKVIDYIFELRTRKARREAEYDAENARMYGSYFESIQRINRDRQKFGQMMLECKIAAEAKMAKLEEARQAKMFNAILDEREKKQTESADKSNGIH